jgi:hypothetical protein
MHLLMVCPLAQRVLVLDGYWLCPLWALVARGFRGLSPSVDWQDSNLLNSYPHCLRQPRIRSVRYRPKTNAVASSDPVPVSYSGLDGHALAPAFDSKVHDREWCRSILEVARATGLEPATFGFGDRCSTN